ncbi:glycosyltransferase [Bacillus cereus]
MMKVKVVFTVHDTNIYNETLNKYPIDMYIAISKTVYDVVNRYVPKEKIRLVYNGVDLEKFRVSRELREKIEKYLILHVLLVLCQKKGARHFN